MLWPRGVYCDRVMYVVAEWCMLWQSDTAHKVGFKFWEMPDRT